LQGVSVASNTCQGVLSGGLSGCCQRFVRDLSGVCQGVVRELSGVVRGLSVGWSHHLNPLADKNDLYQLIAVSKEFVRGLSGSCQGVVKGC